MPIASRRIRTEREKEADPSSLIQVIAKFLQCSDRELGKQLRGSDCKLRVQNYLNDLTEEDRHLLQCAYRDRKGERKYVKFGCLSVRSANEQFAYKGFLGVTVAQHFYARHRIRLQYPGLPCVQEVEEESGECKFYPLELLKISPLPAADSKICVLCGK